MENRLNKNILKICMAALCVTAFAIKPDTKIASPADFADAEELAVTWKGITPDQKKAATAEVKNVADYYASNVRYYGWLVGLPAGTFVLGVLGTWFFFVRNANQSEF